MNLAINSEAARNEKRDSRPDQPAASGAGGDMRARPRVLGKFIFAGDDKLYVRGATYGPFHPDAQGNGYPSLAVVERDFAGMAANGLNAVRVFEVAGGATLTRSLLDIAQRHGLRVMVALSAEQYAGSVIDGKASAADIAELVKAKVRLCAGHPALLCYSLGNEIPAPLVRWYGRRRVERFLERLYRAVKGEDPDGLVTYVNYPTTEYLQLPFLDVVCFNVYLESPDRLAPYLARLHNIAGERPLMLSEIGLDSLRHGEEKQAHSLQCQIRTAFAAGCAGAFVFAWTDDWYSQGADVQDWEFGLTRRDRGPKPALAAVRNAFREAPFPPAGPWPRISVVVCSRNGGRTIRDSLEGLQKIQYPDFEVIVVDDGSTDNTAAIAREYNVRLISTANGGLSRARNIGLGAARGEIVAYLDDDASPDPHWLGYLATAFSSTTHAGVGGPNIAPPEDGPVAKCIAAAPGNPVQVLLSDDVAEHIPGCNMAFRKSCLEAIGGFDPQFRVAGDDVDVCWRIQQRGWTLGFHPAAMVWHHRRNSVRAFWKQQVGYGKAEGMLERKWPEKYNGAGHIRWAGRVYGEGFVRNGWRRVRIYQGIWGSAPFQRLYEPARNGLSSLWRTPEWNLLILGLAALSGLGGLWRPLLLALPLLVLAAGGPMLQAGLSAARASLGAPQSGVALLKRRCLIGFLHLLQPLSRLYGRLCCGLTPWRWRGPSVLALPWPRKFGVWTEQWRDPRERLQLVESALRAAGVPVLRGGEFDLWDLEVRGGVLGAARLRMAVEEPGSGGQFVRVEAWPRATALAVTMLCFFSALASEALRDRAWAPAAVLGLMTAILVIRTAYACSAAMGASLAGVRSEQPGAGLSLPGAGQVAREVRRDQAA